MSTFKKKKLENNIAGVPPGRAAFGYPQYCASTCARSSCTRHASCVDSKPTKKESHCIGVESHQSWRFVRRHFQLYDTSPMIPNWPWVWPCWNCTGSYKFSVSVKKMKEGWTRGKGASDIVKAESSRKDPKATGGLVSNLPYPWVNKTKHHTQQWRFCDAAENGGVQGQGRFQEHWMRAHNRLLDPRSLAEAFLTARTGALVRAIFHHSSRVVFLWRPAPWSRQATAAATRQVPLPGCLHCMPSVSLHVSSRAVCPAAQACRSIQSLDARVPCALLARALPVMLARMPCTCLRVPCPGCCACACPSCARAFPVPARVLCLAFGWHALLRWVSQPHR